MKKLLLVLMFVVLLLPTWPAHAYMTSETSAQSFACIGGTDYTIPFYFLANGDLSVYRVDADGTTTQLTITTDYTLSGAGTLSGGTLTTVATYTDGNVVVARDVAYTQTLDLVDGDGFRADTLERALDRTVMQTQQLSDAVDRAIRLPVSDLSGASGAGMILSPSPLGYLRWNSGGDAIENAVVPGAIDAGDVIYHFDTVAALKAYTGYATVTRVQVMGYYAAGDGGGGPVRYFDAASTATDNGGSVLRPDDIAVGSPGRWLWDYSGPVNVLWFGAVNDGTTDSTTFVQNAIDSNVSSGRYGEVYQPELTDLLFNVYLRNKTHYRGAGGSSIAEPFADSPVFSVPASTAVTNIVVSDLTIDGSDNEVTFTSCDAINLAPTGAGKWVDTVTVERVNINDMGRYGIYMKGAAVAGPFVQSYHLYGNNITGCTDSGLNIIGLVLEGVLIGNKIYSNGDSTHPNAIIQVDTVSGTNPLRQLIIGNVISGISADPLVVTALDLKGTAETLVMCNDLENGNPAINVRHGNSSNVKISGNRFTGNYDAASYVKIDNCNGILTENNRFSVATGKTITAAISYTGAPSALIKPSNHDNVFSGAGTFTNSVAFTTDSQTIADDIIFVYRDYVAVAGEGSLADDIVNIYSEAGGTDISRLEHGRIIRLRANDTSFDVITIKNTGNIAVTSDRVLSATTSFIELMWDSQLSKWVEVSYHA